jgi:putative hydrolase of the HAD superfamily
VVVVALDVDGVLINATWQHGGGWLDVVGPRHGVGLDDMKPFFQGVFHEVVRGRVPVEAALAEHFAALGLAVDHEQFLEDWLVEDLSLNDEVVTAAEEWARAGIPIVLATAQEHRRAARLREVFGDRLALKDILYSAELGVAKPEPEYFRIADERIGGHPVVFIDDALTNVEAARAHGWTAIHYPAETNWRQIVESYFK